MTSGAIHYAIFTRVRVRVQSPKSHFYGMNFRTIRVSYLNRYKSLVRLITRVIPHLPNFVGNNFRTFVTLLLRKGGLIFLLRSHVPIGTIYRRRGSHVRRRRRGRGHSTRGSMSLRSPPYPRHCLMTQNCGGIRRSRRR